MPQFAGAFAGDNPFVPLQVSALLASAGFNYVGLTALQIVPIGSGTLVLSTDPEIDAEEDGVPVPEDPNLSEGVDWIRATGQSGDVVDSNELYLFSETASKAFGIYARALP